ncbi:hypothetical protein [Desulfosporosinus hippei]|uniref:Uncharacterized protein n=1 Tax=Desulfosporosinus hippei DSM 8344 TaxID=1121419 RepID=A0A1G8C4Y1_9FIRM|nr:hypothetical protein [Desulfosporosinus hippei]SDH40455.1 hypothetical protein SAMN05443529_1134 [Desulfosporosinus hippei DSM 8344]
MATNKKGSRKIIVCDTEYRWRATGNDGWISVAIWPANKDDVRLTGTFFYHDEYENDHKRSFKKVKGQIIITNKIIRRIIESVGVEIIQNTKGQINLGSVEKIVDIKDALREEI